MVQAVLCVLLVGLAALPLMDARGLVVTSGSMEPTIGVGALALVVPVDTDQVRAGDVLTYHGYGQDRLTTHRVIDVVELDSGRHFQTRGDANDAADPNLAPAQGVVGRVGLTLPHAGRLLTLMMQRWVLLALVALTAIPPLLTELRGLWARVARGRSRQRRARPATLLVAGLTGVVAAAGGVTASNAVLTDHIDVPDNTFATSDDFTT